MRTPKFSIITPTRNRDGRYENGKLERCIKSIRDQRYPVDLFEHILVDDGNNDEDKALVKYLTKKYYTGKKISYRIVDHKSPTEGYIAYNDGMRAINNDWLVFLDDDDEYSPLYLDYVAQGMMKNPRHKLFNYGGLVCNHKDGWMRARGAVKFKHKVGARVESGDIVNGQFCFHRSALEKHPEVWMPETSDLYKAADMANIPGYGSKERVLGNPYGQDFYIFYKLTRYYISCPLDLYVYICYPRGTE